MTQTDTGGNAYPIEGAMVDASGAICGKVVYSEGMTLLDYFAGQAWSDEELGLIGTTKRMVSDALAVPVGDIVMDTHWPMYIARRRYDIATAMIAEKRRREST
jgi:hypothetical protein